MPHAVQLLTCTFPEWSGPNDVAWVAFAGRVEMNSAPAFRRQLDRLVHHSTLRGLAVDLRGISYMDSSGVAVLVECLRWCRDYGTALVLVAPSKSVREAMEIVNLSDAFEIVEGDEAGLRQRFAETG